MYVITATLVPSVVVLNPVIIGFTVSSVGSFSPTFTSFTSVTPSFCTFLVIFTDSPSNIPSFMLYCVFGFPINSIFSIAFIIVTG